MGMKARLMARMPENTAMYHSRLRSRRWMWSNSSSSTSVSSSSTAAMEPATNAVHLVGHTRRTLA